MDIVFEEGEFLMGLGLIVVGDIVCWVVGDIESGSGDIWCVYILVKLI